MRSSRLLFVLVLTLLALGASACTIRFVPAAQTEPPVVADGTEDEEDAEEATTGEETEDDVEPAVRDDGEDDDEPATAPVPRERPDRQQPDASGEDEEGDDRTADRRTRDRAERDTVDDTNRVPPRPRSRPGADGSDSGEETEADAGPDDEGTESDGDDAPEPDDGDEDDGEPEASSDDDRLTQRQARREARRRARRRARGLHVPPGHYPPEGECRIWYEGRPPGQQPAPAPCDQLAEREFDGGAFILYGGEAWDGAYDWEALEMEHPGAVPRPVLLLVRVVGDGER